MRRLSIGLILLITATSFNGVFAQADSTNKQVLTMLKEFYVSYIDLLSTVDIDNHTRINIHLAVIRQNKTYVINSVW